MKSSLHVFVNFLEEVRIASYSLGLKYKSFSKLIEPNIGAHVRTCQRHALKRSPLLGSND